MSNTGIVKIYQYCPILAQSNIWDLCWFRTSLQLCCMIITCCFKIAALSENAAVALSLSGITHKLKGIQLFVVFHLQQVTLAHLYKYHHKSRNGLFHFKSIHPLWKILEKCTEWGVGIFKCTHPLMDFYIIHHRGSKCCVQKCQINLST